MWMAEAKLKRRLHLSKDYSHPDNIFTFEKGETVTITKGREQKYSIWSHLGIWDIDEEYIDKETIKVKSEN